MINIEQINPNTSRINHRFLSEWQFETHAAHEIADVLNACYERGVQDGKQAALELVAVAAGARLAACNETVFVPLLRDYSPSLEQDLRNAYRHAYSNGVIAAANQIISAIREGFDL